ncbi:MAG: DUF547 domain-containing protein [Candidatus Binatia bacterium]
MNHHRLFRHRVRHFTLFALSAILLMAFLCTPPSQAAVDHSVWDALLRRYVDAEGRVAYRDLQTKDATAFAQYLQTLAAAQVDNLSEAEEKALWLNAYNAVIVKGVLDGYTAEGWLSRKRLFSWYSIPVAGQARTPDEIEHEILRKKFRDPRIHFAIVCASTSCPKLRPEAYVPERLDQQLDDAARAFVNDPQRNRVVAGNVAVSMIFKWFAQDFIDDAGSVWQFVQRFVAEDKKDVLKGDAGQLQYLEYDWTLNAQKGQRVS